MKLPSFFKNKESRQQSTPWQWPSCKHPKTFSFRVQDDIFKTVNSVFFDPNDGVETPDSWFTNSADSASFSTEQSELEFDGESLEMVIRGARSEERLFFEAGGGGDTSSILKKGKKVDQVNEEFADDDPFKESVVLAMDSDNPYLDFKKSMEEMVEIHGLKDWKCLEELLGWYLRMNLKKNHGFIVDAFVDLLVGLATCSDDDDHHHHSHHDSTSYCSAGSSFSSSSLSRTPLCILEDEIEIDDEEEKLALS
ncbi:hypothetical protein JRO89_XS14G0007200 [Xanthoceras sorbifolium]|uniref:Transcription repressor n=1 Tax=Xanthoceras sorbifolium TaxID=99658 RepID=A0ABQ8H358_9ROSI|nr:hypothetical protein JRO89_XS14G0007200 [Xanthoceras sorbifolium]